MYFVWVHQPPLYFNPLTGDTKSETKHPENDFSSSSSLLSYLIPVCSFIHCAIFHFLLQPFFLSFSSVAVRFGKIFFPFESLVRILASDSSSSSSFYYHCCCCCCFFLVRETRTGTLFPSGCSVCRPATAAQQAIHTNHITSHVMDSYRALFLLFPCEEGLLQERREEQTETKRRKDVSSLVCQINNWVMRMRRGKGYVHGLYTIRSFESSSAAGCCERNRLSSRRETRIPFND